jgi:hypothetical protein
MAGMGDEILIKMLNYNGKYESTWQLRSDIGVSDRGEDSNLQEFMQTIKDLVKDEMMEWDKNTLKNHERLRAEHNEDMINHLFGQWHVRITSEGIKEARIVLAGRAKTVKRTNKRRTLSRIEEQEILDKQGGKCAMGGETFSSKIMPQFDILFHYPKRVEMGLRTSKPSVATAMTGRQDRSG